ncbi:MAG: hypothetical protein AAGC97_16535 [Planctomycetota bacterium]
MSLTNIKPPPPKVARAQGDITALASDMRPRGADVDSVYRWGLAVATGREPSRESIALSQLAVLPALSRRAARDLSSVEPSTWLNWADQFLHTSMDAVTDVVVAHQTLLWGVALPGLVSRLPSELWEAVWLEVERRREACRDDPASHGTCQLILGGEYAMMSAWHWPEWADAHRRDGLDIISTLFAGGEETISQWLMPAESARLAAGSVMRLMSVLPITSHRKFKKAYRDVAFDLGCWIAAMTRHDATAAFSIASSSDDSVDGPSGQKRSGSPKSSRQRPDDLGLLERIIDVDSVTLKSAVEASIGRRHTGGRLAWEVSLPETFWHDVDARLAIMLPEWDVRRGRIFIDYSRDDMVVEIMGGRCMAFRGPMQTMVEVDGTAYFPSGPWESTCEFTDDDVHYIEFEQVHAPDNPLDTGSRDDQQVTLQRQFMVVRDDRAVMIADSIMRGSDGTHPEIRTVMRLPVDPSMQTSENSETREVFLGETTSPRSTKQHGKSRLRAMMIPLAANEWRVGTTVSRLSVTEDRIASLAATGKSQVFNPLWIDFQSRRFTRKRTWRQLTVCETLRLVPPDEAVAFRVQVGSEHWVVYRSMRPSGAGGFIPRSFMGKHLLADFFAARFHPGDGGMEELVTVDAP